MGAHNSNWKVLGKSVHRLLFTIKKAPLPAGVRMPGLKSALYCNILGIVVLAEPSDTAFARNGE